MPDLSNRASHQYWYEYVDPMVYKVVSFMEGVEDWTLDGDPEVENSIEKLGAALDNIGSIDLKKEEQFVTLAAYIRAARNLRLLQALDLANPGAASKIIAYAEHHTSSTEDVSGLFLRRNIIFERLRLLGRVFSNERLALVSKALEENYA